MANLDLEQIAPTELDATDLAFVRRGEGPYSGQLVSLAPLSTALQPGAQIPWTDVTGAPSFFSGAYGDLTGIPATFAPSAHGHVIADVEGLQSALDGVGDVSGPASATDNAIVVFDGATGKLVKAGGASLTDNGSLILPENSAPTGADAGTMKLFSRQIANRLLPSFIGPSGLDSAIQPLLARNKVGYWNPPGNATTAPGIFGFTNPTVTGFTTTARSVAAANLFTRMRRLGYQTSATAGTVGNWRVNANQYTVGSSTTGLGGFTYILRFGISDPVPVESARMFMGMRVSATPTNVEPSTLTNCIGIGHGAADTNFRIYYGGTVAQASIDLGENFPRNTRNVDAYELALFSAPNSGDVHWHVTRINTGHVATGSITNTSAQVLPQNNTLLAIWGYRTNNTAAQEVGLDVMSAYIETDQ